MRDLLRRPLVACALLLTIYVGLSFLNDPRGYLGTDTGGKVATLEVMARDGTTDPDVGYWAEKWDPRGDLHPLYYTNHLGDRWVNVTTLPALELALPLYRVGGYRLALLLPMLGSLLAALAARSIARFLRRGCGDLVFWAIGLASPLAIYALDFWEHSLGVASVAWAVRLILPAVQGDRARWRGFAAGALFGVAATMRTEAFVYGTVAVGTACLVILVGDRQLRHTLWTGGGALVSIVMVTSAGYGLEFVVLGHLLRAGRTTGTAVNLGSAGGTRLQEAAVTALGLIPGLGPSSLLIGVGLVSLLVLFALKARPGGDGGIAVVCGAGVVALYVLRVIDGRGFIPGLIPAAPLAGISLVLLPRARSELFLMAVAVVSLPLVWASQFQGGAVPQWGGRYLLVSGLLMATLALCHLDRLLPAARVAVLSLSALVTLFGLAWLSVRSHQMADAQRALVGLHEPVLVSTVAHLPREGGAFYLRQRWLTAVTDGDVAQAASVLVDAGVDRFALVGLAGEPVPEVPGWRPGATRVVSLFDGIDLEVRSYAREAG